MSPLVPRAVALACAGCVAWGDLSFRPAAAIIGVAAAALVRVPLWKAKSRWWVELSFMLLGCLGAFVTIVDHALAPGTAFWTGVGFGAVASSLLEIGKSAWLDRLQSALKVLAGISVKGPEA